MTKSDGVEIRPAATVLVVRDQPTFEVLMIERRLDARFAGGALVFPGGRVDAADHDPAWREHVDGLADEPAVAAGQIAALRETFEEVGVLIARRGDGRGALVSGDDAAAFDAERAGVAADAARFQPLLRAAGLRLACDALTPFAHWIGPPSAPRQYDTRFFLVAAPDGQAAREDGDEATHAAWFAPKEAVRLGEARERKVIYPTMCNLQLLALDASCAAARDRARARPFKPVRTQSIHRDGVEYLRIPDDLGYPMVEMAAARVVRS